jgi:site-specific recombinase XerD
MMEKKPLLNLLQELEEELIRLGYTEGSMKFYRNRWQKLQNFAVERHQTHFTEQLGLDFLESCCHLLEKESTKSLSQNDTQQLRVIRMIGDFQLHQSVLRRYYKQRNLLQNSYFLAIADRFEGYCENKGYSNVTTEHYVKQTKLFMDYLVSQNVTDCDQIALPVITSYILTLSGYSYKTIEQKICSIRAFLRYLLDTDIIGVDLATKIPMVRARKQTRIPSVWTNEELTALIKAIDRGNPKGKRDYAMILLACILGLRVGDIKKLTFSSFKWKTNELEFTQSKTKETTVLPLPAEVGWSVIDYLKNGRPKVDSEFVFVRHLAPFLPFAEADHLAQIIRDYMRLARLPILKKHRGMHSLRHTAASRMLEIDTPLAVISDILGHTDTDSTSVYLKVDINRLRECCLELQEGIADE